MPTPQERVASAMRFFFEQALPQSTSRTFSQLSDPLVHLGRYIRHAGGAVPTSLGQEVTPLFALRVSAALPVAGGQPNPAGATVADGGPLRHLLWVRHAADAAVDDAEEIRRVLADMDSFANLFEGQSSSSGTTAGESTTPGGTATPGGTPTTGGTGGEAAPAPPAAPATPRVTARAAEWAEAIVASRASLAVNLPGLTQVPEPLRPLAGDLATLKQVLQHFFTYNAEGTYYRRWSGAGRDASNAAHLTPEYKRENVREVQLERERIYVYMVVPESLLAGGGDLGQGVFREVVVRLDDTGEEQRPFRLATLHTARWRRNTAPHEDFVFFFAEDGLGMPVETSVRNKMSPRLQALLADYFAAPEAQRDAILLESQVVSDVGEARLHLLAMVEGTPTYPGGVQAAAADGPIVPLLAPPARVPEVAALPQVKKLTTVPVATPMLNEARTMVQYAGLDSRIAAASRGGKGVLVGVIDTGIDGSHPAFAGRLVAYWDQSSPAVLAGNTPKGNHAGNTAYDDFDWGRELEGAATSGALDTHGHGTHVAGIAAGAEVRDAAGNVICPAGLAPQAKIVAVRTIGVGGGDISRAIRYIFQKARELSMPCVINMSFGHNDHGHDAGDSGSIDAFHTVHPASTNAYTAGRILIGAAGNERGTGTHIFKRIAAGPSAYTTIQVRLGSKLPATPPTGVAPIKHERVVVWVKNPTGVCPLSFPLYIWVFREANSLAGTSIVQVGSNLTPPAFLPGLQMRVAVTSMLWDPSNGDFRFHVDFAYTAPGNVNMPNDPWIIALINGSTHPLEVHSWITAGWRGGGVFGGTVASDDSYLVGAPADSPGVVSVASVDSRLRWRPHGATTDANDGGTVREISSFSSPGPLRPASVSPATIYNVTDDIRSVDVTAPGNRLQSAATSHPANAFRARDIVTRDGAGLVRSIMMQGTSMASPVVTGMVANLLAVKPNLTVPQVIDRLKRCSTIPASSAFQPVGPTPSGSRPWSKDWGYGLVDGTTLDLT